MSSEGIGNDKNDDREGSPTGAEQKRASTSVQSLDSVLALFKAGDDTSNFVAISLLRTLLDERKELREDKNTLLRCWDAIPPRFLNRLLKARPNEKRTNEEAQSMIALAVSIIHVFVNLLPREMLEEKNLSKHADDLIAAVPLSSPTTVSQISQTLLTLNFPSLLFSNVKGNGATPKPSSYLFIKMLLIDIRSTIPSLQERLNAPEYPTVSMRIAESFDVISMFIGCLVEILDEEPGSDEYNREDSTQLHLEPSQLLQLRTDISETLSLTIEHIRDRYDSSIAGAAGLHPSARVNTESSSSAPRTITWQSSNTSMSEDPLTLSEIRTLALWLREDDNDALRREAAGIMDVLFNLSSEANSGADFRSPVLIALEGIFMVPEGIETFLNQDGWSSIFQLLKKALNTPGTSAIELGLGAVRVLLAVAESDVTGPSKEDWMGVIVKAVEALEAPTSPNDERLDLHIAVAQLAVELLSKAPRNVRKKYAGQAFQLSRVASAKLGAVDGEREESLLEVIEGLEDLDVRGRR